MSISGCGLERIGVWSGGHQWVWSGEVSEGIS